MKQIAFIIFLLSQSLTNFAQQITLSNSVEISVITVDPGYQLNDAFGHSAFRVNDPLLDIDQAYNYGMYDYDTPNFYGKFAQGKLLYNMASYPFQFFLRSYVQQNRTVKEQILNLSTADKQLFFNYLQNNAKPENKSYLYEFFYDNCATKLKDVSQEVLKEKVDFTYSFTKGRDDTFRDLIHQYSNVHPWGTFGIDLALGSIIDKTADPESYLFLPDYIYASYAESTINNKPLVKKTKILFSAQKKENENKIFSPLIIFSLVSLLVLFITYKDHKRLKRSKWLDFILFFMTGVIGVVVLLLWLATDHTATKNNFNILWAFMPNVFVAFTLLKKEFPVWMKKYLLLLLTMLIVVIILWLLKIQVFSIGIIPILILLTLRYLYLYKNYKKI